MKRDLEGLCNDARRFWDRGPWRVSDLTSDHRDKYVVPFHYEGDPEIEAFATPELVEDALGMDRTAIEVLDQHLKSMTP